VYAELALVHVPQLPQTATQAGTLCATAPAAPHHTPPQGWAAAWARLIAPGGELVTLIYPVDASLPVGEGPPWPVTPELYKQLLPPGASFVKGGGSRLCGDVDVSSSSRMVTSSNCHTCLPAGFELLLLQQVPDALSHPSRAGREWVGRWRRVAGPVDAQLS
jgi:hypothetical protein